LLADLLIYHTLTQNTQL